MEKFDADLKKRMTEIRKHETNSYTEQTEKTLIRMVLGYAIKNKYGKSWWIGAQIAWQRRNVERISEYNQTYNAKHYDPQQYRAYYITNANRIKARVRKYYSTLT
jgi:hypothetical protein